MQHAAARARLESPSAYRRHTWSTKWCHLVHPTPLVTTPRAYSPSIPEKIPTTHYLRVSSTNQTQTRRFKTRLVLHVHNSHHLRTHTFLSAPRTSSPSSPKRPIAR
jgi:hypothetical protein